MPDRTSCCRAGGGYYQRCDLLVGLGGLRVTAVEYDHDVGLLCCNFLLGQHGGASV